MAKAPRESDVERLLRPDVARELAVAIPGFDRRALLTSFIDCFGGVEKFAQNIYVEYMAAPAGSMAKQRWGGLICTLMSQESQVEHARPVDMMTEEEIHASLMALAPRVAPGVKLDG